MTKTYLTIPFVQVQQIVQQKLQLQQQIKQFQQQVSKLFKIFPQYKCRNKYKNK